MSILDTQISNLDWSAPADMDAHNAWVAADAARKSDAAATKRADASAAHKTWLASLPALSAVEVAEREQYGRAMRTARGRR